MGFSLLPSPLHMSQQAKAAPKSQNRKSLNFQDKIDRKSKVSKPSDVETVETVEAAEATRAGTRKERPAPACVSTERQKLFRSRRESALSDPQAVQRRAG